MQLHGDSLSLRSERRIPRPRQTLQDALASPIAFDRFHCIIFENVLVASLVGETALSFSNNLSSTLEVDRKPSSAGLKDSVEVLGFPELCLRSNLASFQ